MKKLAIASLIITTSICSYANLKDTNPLITDKLLDAIEITESSQRTGLRVLDTNNLYSYGAYQIQEPYLADVNRIYGTNYSIEQVKTNKTIARSVVKKYISYYSNVAKRKLGRKLTTRELVAIHNGGPTGYKKPKALTYADKVLKELN